MNAMIWPRPAEALDVMRGAAANLAFGCAGLSPGARVLLVAEAASDSHFCPALPEMMRASLGAIGVDADIIRRPFDPEAQDLPPALSARMAGADATIFLARLGDQVRFHAMPPGQRIVVCYASNGPAYLSAFALAPYAAFVEIMAAVDKALLGAARVDITCPNGTRVSGASTLGPGQAPDVTVRRFPLLAPTPVPASGFSGRVALCGFLTGSCNRYYDPFTVEFGGQVFAVFERGRLTGFDGAPDDVAQADAHYDRVSARFGIDRDFVHSWHAGIHPGCAYLGAAADDYAGWSATAFGNPRLLHFHSCGAYAPGEICWSVVDPTITADGVEIWNEGRLCLHNLPGGPDIARRHPAVADLFAAPETAIGV